MVRVRVPATTANLGAGFDCLGLALQLYNEVEAVSQDELTITIEGAGASDLPTDESNMVWRAAQRVFEHCGQTSRGARLHLRNAIPLESGLGSSAAAAVAGLLVGNALLGGPLSRAELLELAVAMEGHADNVAPALLGGLVAVARADDGPLLATRVEQPGLQVVVAMPAFRLSTAVARRALPREVKLTDATYNLGHVALTLLAFQRGDYDLLRLAMTDRLHQPYRAPLVPGLAAALAAARDAGAAAAISGAGPALVAFTPTGHTAIGHAITSAFAAAGLQTQVWILADANGAEVTSGDAVILGDRLQS